jgi:superfamily II DNA or RNA helicase
MLIFVAVSDNRFLLWHLTFYSSTIFMHQSKIDLYNSFPDHEKQVLKMAALKAAGFNVHDIINLLPFSKMQPQQVKSILKAAAQHGLFGEEKSWGLSYYVSTDFMLYIYPELSDFRDRWSVIHKNERFSYFYHEALLEIHWFRDCLYSLLFLSDEEYKSYENQYTAYPTAKKAEYYSLLIQSEKYAPYLHRISKPLLQAALHNVFLTAVYMLKPLSEVVRLFEWVEQHSKYDNIVGDACIHETVAFFAGRFKDISWNPAREQGLFLKAAVELIAGNKNEAFTLFENGLKMQRKNLKETSLPLPSYFVLYYLVTLLNMDVKGALALQKISRWMEKKGNLYPILIEQFEPAVSFALYGQVVNRWHIQTLLRNISAKETRISMPSMLSLLVLYIVGEKPGPAYSDNVFEIAQQARLSGYTILAYEAAYVACTWYGSEQAKVLYHEIAAELSCKPVLSQILRQEDWEKSLNLLLGLKSSTPKAAPNGESKTRIVYYFNPNDEHIRPMLQTRQAKGWSTGRNIAMKNFFSGKTPGMTTQDILISKTIENAGDYYGEYHIFSDKVFPALVAHPYIFLDNSKDVPVEFIAAKPVITVAKTSKGYALSSDIKDLSDNIFLQKETNTRYRVYELTPQQIKILQIIAGQKIVVPEAGKEKLISLLGTFSAHGMDVHSDLLASESTQITVKEVPADSRIRVQLLPFGDGLKAELFVKPFGTHPPYCKPGKGGRVLIANEKDMQLQVKRNLREETTNEGLLLNEIQSLESLTVANDLMAFDNPLDSLHLLDILAKCSEACVVEWPEGERYKIRGSADFGQLHLKLESNISWFDLQGELRVDENTVISLQKLLTLAAQGHHQFIELSSGEFLALSKELKKQLDALCLYTTVAKDDVRLNKFASVALGDFFDNVEDLKADNAWKQFRERVSSAQRAAAVPSTLQAELRSYQEEGFRWMSCLAEWEGGACLADDMGLGKTVQTLALLLHRAAKGPALVVCPVSVIGNWVSEAGRFAPTLRIKTLGSATQNRQEAIRTLEAGDLLITSYGLLQSEEKLLTKPSFATVVLDEAHAIKNYTTKTSKASMQLKAAFRVALTGTPVQNHLGEVWNLFNFTNPGLLGSLQHFTETFIKPDDEATRRHLKRLITPFLLRRTKSAVLDELPPKTEIVKKIQLSGEEMAFYEALRRQAIENLSSNDASANPGAKQLQVLAEITKLRQASCNPLLIDKNIQIASSKLATFLEIASELKENNHRALVFSQFVAHLSIVRKALDERGVAYQYLDGSSSPSEREKSIRKFQGGEGDLFLISLKAGGLGLNLTAADFVIHLDPWWNPAIEDQASDRAHRIGQTRPVTIYRLVAENTIEEKIIQLHSAKRDLAESLLEGSDRSARLSMNELVALIAAR